MAEQGIFLKYSYEVWGLDVFQKEENSETTKLFF